MGEAKQEEAKAENKTEEEAKQVEKKEEKPEEMKEEKKEEEKKEEQKKEEEKKEKAKPASPSPTVLFVDLHCVGCAKKIERTILKCQGVEAVEMDMTKNQVTVKGIVDPQALCERIKKKTMRSAKVLSPLAPADGDPAKPDGPPPQNVSGVSTVELHVNMHCEACAEQLQKKILKMRGVQTAETNLSASKVTVTGTMNADKLVEYVYRRTRKLAKVVPQPPKEEEPEKEEGEQKAEEKPSEEEKKGEANEEAKKKEEKAEKKEEEKPSQPQENGEEGAKEEKPAEGGGGGEEQKKEGERAPDTVVLSAPGDDDMAKRMMYWAPAYGPPVYGAPVYMIERLPPPPQLFSDENPNACCIS